MPIITAVQGNITEQDVDAIVNAANTTTRGGGGVDGALHRTGGPRILRECIQRFPIGLAVGDAGWTTAGDLPAQWVIHTVGPNYRAGQRDRALLESCYRRALEEADELGARSVAFPLISTGNYGWPTHDAIATAIQTIAATRTGVDEIRLVTLEYSTQQAVRDRLASWTPFRILQGIRVLHQRGYHRLRVWPGSTGASPWRVMVSYPDYVDVGGYSEMRTVNIPYAVGAGMEFADGEVTVATSPDAVADLVLRSLPMAGPTVDDPDYVSWFDTLMKIVDAVGLLPLAYGDYFDESGGWEIGWDSGIRYPTLLGHPRRERRALAGLSTRSQLAENPPVYGPRGADAVFVE